jgi:hypothetical protein
VSKVKLAIENKIISVMVRLLEGGIFSLAIGRKYKYETSKAAMLMIFFPKIVLSWKNMPKLMNPKITTGKNKLNIGTKGLL